MITLGFKEIYELGVSLNENLFNNGIKSSTLTIFVENKDELRKIDEDLYYRQNPNGEDFKPSDDMIEINFEYVTFKILIKEDEKNKKEGKDNIQKGTL